MAAITFPAGAPSAPPNDTPRLRYAIDAANAVFIRTTSQTKARAEYARRLAVFDHAERLAALRQGVSPDEFERDTLRLLARPVPNEEDLRAAEESMA